MLNFESVNCDGKHIKWEFNTPNEVHRLFWSDTCPLPSNDDPIVHAELDGKPLPQCKAFLDLLHMLGLDEEQYPSEKGKTYKLIAIDLDNTLVDYTTAFKDCISQLQKKPFNAPELARHYWRAQRLWSPSYYAGTAGGAPLDTLKRYIENQNRPA